MAIIDVTQEDVLNAIVDHYRVTLGLDDARAFLSIEPISTHIPRSGDYWLTVSAGDGTFEQEMVSSGVVEQCTEDSTFVVTGHVRLHLDQTDEDSQLLVRAGQGLLPLKRAILKTIAGVDLQVNGSEFSRELITPRHCGSTMVVEPIDEEGGLQIGIVSVTFGLMFDWDLLT